MRQMLSLFKRGLLFILAVLIVGLLMYFSFFAFRSYSGICSDTGKALDNKQKIRLAMEKTYADYYLGDYGKYVVTKDENLAKSIQPIFYVDSADFYSKNLYCCAFMKSNYIDPEWTPPGFVDKLFGMVSDVVIVEFLYGYIDTDGTRREKKIKTMVALSNCGVARKIN